MTMLKSSNCLLLIVCCFCFSSCQLSFQDTTPEGILGERGIETKISGSCKTIQKVYLIYSPDSMDVVNHNDTTSVIPRTDIGVNLAHFVSDSYKSIFAHSGSRKDNRNTTVNAGILMDSTRLYYKWLVYYSNSMEKSVVRSFRVPRPLNISIIGDSYSSGEGAPASNAMWLNANCHRSENSGQFLGVGRFLGNNPNIAAVYKYLFVSASGAHVTHLLTSPYDPQFCDVVNPVSEKPQLKQLVDTLNENKNYNKIDAVIVSIGGNDMGFVPAMMEVLGPGNLVDHIDMYSEKIKRLPVFYHELDSFLKALCIDKVFITNYPNPTQSDKPGNPLCGLPPDLWGFIIESIVEQLILGDLANAGRYCDMGEAVFEFAFGDDGVDNCAALHIFQNEYYDAIADYIVCNGFNFDPMQLVDALAIYLDALSRAHTWDEFYNMLVPCTGVSTGNSTEGLLTTLLGFRDEIAAARDKFLIPMNDTMKRVSAELQWHCIDDVFENSKNNGICACSDQNRFFNSIDASLMQQGSIYGTMHMNIPGQTSIFAASVSAELQRWLAPRQNRLETPFSANCFDVPKHTSNAFKKALEEVNEIDEMIEKDEKEKFEEFKKKHKDTEFGGIVKKLNTKEFKDAYKKSWEQKKFNGMRDDRIH